VIVKDGKMLKSGFLKDFEKETQKNYFKLRPTET